MNLTQVLKLVKTVNEQYNQILENAKKINELLAQGTFEPTSVLAVWNPETEQTEKVQIQTIIDQIISGNNSLINQLISVGEITIDGNDITIPSGVNWTIQGVPYFTTEDAIFNIPFASAGNIRIDIIVANTLGELVKYSGTESTGVAFRPNIPLNTVLVTQINVTNSSIAPIDFGLSSDEMGAIHNSNYPTASNPFATVNDLIAGATIPFDTFQFVRKGYGNSGAIGEAGDIYQGWVSDGVFCPFAVYDGSGPFDDSASFNIVTTNEI
jgi:hypothetical protein